MSAPIETPEAMALRLFPGVRGDAMSTVGQCIAVPAIRARDEQIAAALEAEANASESMSGAHFRKLALRAFAAKLRGAS